MLFFVFVHEASIGECDKHVWFWCINIIQLELLRASTCMKPIWWSDISRYHYPFPDSGPESVRGRILVVPPAVSLCQDSNLLGTQSILNSLSNHFYVHVIYMCVYMIMCVLTCKWIHIFGIHTLRPEYDTIHKVASSSVVPWLWPKPLG